MKRGEERLALGPGWAASPANSAQTSVGPFAELLARGLGTGYLARPWPPDASPARPWPATALPARPRRRAPHLLPGEERLPDLPVPLLQRHQVGQVHHVVAHHPVQVLVGTRTAVLAEVREAGPRTEACRLRPHPRAAPSPPRPPCRSPPAQGPPRPPGRPRRWAAGSA